MRHLDLARDLLELFAVCGVGDLAADPAAAGRVRHQDAIAPGQRKVGCQGRALVATLFLDDLHEQDLADLDDFLDLVAARTRFPWRADVFLIVIIRNGFDAVILGRRIGRLALGRVVLVIVIAVSRGIGCVVFGIRGCLIALLFGGVRRCIRGCLIALLFGLVRAWRFHWRFLDGFHRRGGLVLGHVGLVEVDGFHPLDILGRCGVPGVSLGRLGTGRTPTFRLGFVFFLVAGLLRFGIGAFFFHQRLAIRDRDLIVVGMDFRERKEAVAIAAIVYKGRLQRRLDPCYLCEIDVASKLALVFGFKVKLLDLVSVHHHDAGLFRVGGIDKHFLRHECPLRNRTAPAPGGARFRRLCLV